MFRFGFVLLVSALALAESHAPGAGNKPGLTPFIPMILIFGIFYVMMIRPQQKKAKLHQQFLGGLKRGDAVVTQSGIVGTVKNLSERFVFLEVDEGVSLKILRNQILENANNLKEESKPKS